MYRTKILVYSNKEPSAILLKMIKKNGLNVRVAKTIESVFELLHKKAYKLLYIDITGFKMDIEETINRIVAIKNDIVITAIIPRNKGIIYTKLINNGIFDILQKPLNPIAIQASLKRCLYVVKLHREIGQSYSQKTSRTSTTYTPLSDAEIENLGLDELIKKKLSVLFSKPAHKKLINLYSIVMPIIERSFIETALQLSNNNQVKASLLLGINRNTLKAKMIKFNIKND